MNEPIDLKKLSSEQIKDLIGDEIDNLKEEISYLNVNDPQTLSILTIVESIENMLVKV